MFHMFTQTTLFLAVPHQNRYFRHESDPHRHSTRTLFFGEPGRTARLKLESILVLSVSTGSTANKQERTRTHFLRHEDLKGSHCRSG